MEDNYVARIFFLILRVWWDIFRFLIGIILSIVTIVTRHQDAQRKPDLREPTKSSSQQETSNEFVLRSNFDKFVIVSGITCIGIVCVLIGISQIGAQSYDNHSDQTIKLAIFGFGIVCLILAMWINKRVSTNTRTTAEHKLGNRVSASSSAPEGKLYIYTLRLPTQTLWEPRRAFQLMEQLLQTFDSMIFRIVAQHRGIHWQIVDLTLCDPTLVEQAIRTSYPDIDISREPLQPLDIASPFYRYVVHYQQAAEFVMPIQYVTDIKELDPLANLTQTMNDLQPDESIYYTLCVIGHASYAYDEGTKRITQHTIHPLQFLSSEGLLDAARKKATGQDKMEKYLPEFQKVMENKLQQRLYQTSLLIEINTPNKERIRALGLVDSQLVSRSLVNSPE